MQFFLFDVALAFVALLGYRAVAAVVQYKVAVASLPKPLALKPAAPRRLPRRDPPRAPLHRLINFW